MKSGLRTGERTQVIRLADKALAMTAVAVTDKVTTISGNRHNYESLATYYWPDTLHTGRYVPRDGYPNPEVQQYDYPRLRTMSQNVKYLVQAYYITGEERYARAAIRQLTVWFMNRLTRMNPNFDYSQIIKGQNDNHGQPFGMIDTCNFHDVLDAVRLLHHQNRLSARQMKKITAWMATFAAWMQQSEYGKAARTYKNNIGVNYDSTLYDLCLFTGDKKTRESLFSSFIDHRIKGKIGADGRQPEELKRTNAFSYSVYNLEQLTSFFLLARADGQDVSILRSHLLRAANYLQSFVGHHETFPYQQASDWKYHEWLLQQLEKQLH